MNCDAHCQEGYCCCRQCQREIQPGEVRECTVEAPLVPQSLTIFPCRHRGDEKREQFCPDCIGNVRVKIFSCDLFAECTLGKVLENIAGTCQTCLSREPPVAIGD